MKEQSYLQYLSLFNYITACTTHNAWIATIGFILSVTFGFGALYYRTREDGTRR